MAVKEGNSKVVVIVATVLDWLTALLDTPK